MDKFGLDGHKLGYHVSRLSDWLDGKNTYPVYMEISPTGACNHRCSFCGLDFMKYQARSLDIQIIKERITELGGLGLKSVMYGGEGEPLLYKNIAELAAHTKASGIDASITTNGVLLKSGLAEKILGELEWIKVSLNAGDRETYSIIHKTKMEDFDQVVENMATAKKIKDANGYPIALGMQMVLLPENRSGVDNLAKIARDIGMDYLVVKPFSQHPMSGIKTYASVGYEESARLAEEMEKYNTSEFCVVVRVNAMRKHDTSGKGYNRCLALPFWSYIDAGGNIWGCSVYLSDERFLYGNIYERSFKEIWEGEKRRSSLEWVENEMDASRCRINCRMDSINSYLTNLKSPPAHANFI